MACWDGYKQVGMKKKGNRSVPNCVPISEIVKLAKENICVNCGNVVTENILDENLKKWFSDKWVNIGKKDKSGKHPPCGTSGKKRGYAKCVPKSKAGSMSKKEKESATRRKRAAQNKAGRGGTSDVSGGGKKPIRVKTKAESVMNLSKEKLIEMIKEEYQNILSENNMMTEAQFDEAAGKKDACYSKVKSRYDVWPSAYASGALVKCRKVGAKNWGNSKKESVDEAVYQFKRYTNTQMDELDAELRRGGFRGTPDFNKMTYTTDEISSKLDKIVKRKGGKKIKESVDEGKLSEDYKNSEWEVYVADENGKEKIVKKAKSKRAGVILYNKLINSDKYHEVGMRVVKESVDEGLLKEDIEDLKKIVKELEGASKMHAGQAKRIKAHLDDMNVGESVEEPVEEAYDIWTEDGSFGGTFTGLIEAEYQGRKVKLGKPMQGDAKKFKVYVKNPKGNTVKVNFGQGGDAKGGTMRIRKSNPNARKNFRARHNCDSPGPRHKARYWSCRKW